jgi:hypothetical protein
MEEEEEEEEEEEKKKRLLRATFHQNLSETSLKEILMIPLSSQIRIERKQIFKPGFTIRSFIKIYL